MLRAIYDPYVFFRLYFPDWRRSGNRVIENAPWQIYEMRKLGKVLSGRDEHDAPLPGKFASARFRESAKTTESTMLVLWALLHGHRRVVIICRDNVTLASAVLQAVQRIIGDQNHPLTKAYGLELWPARAMKAPGMTWSTVQLTLPCLTGGTATLYAAGKGQNLRGMLGADNLRPDYVLLDDIEDNEAVSNPAQREKMRDWLTKDVLPLGQTCVFDLKGTILHYDSLLANVLTWNDWQTSSYAALDDQGNSTWPEKWPTEMLLAKKASYVEKGCLHAWQTEYMNEPISREECMFPSDCWQTYGKGQYLTAPDRQRFDLVVAGADTANSAKKESDYSVIAVWGIMSDGTYHLVDLVRGQWDWHTLLTTCLSINERVRPDVWAVENKASGQQLIQEMERLHVPVDKVEASTDLVARAQPMQPAFAQRLVWRKPANTDWLVEEMELFPHGKHDDGVAASIAAFKRLLFKRRVRVFA